MAKAKEPMADIAINMLMLTVNQNLSIVGI